MADLYVYTGCHKSGKTDAIIRAYERAKIQKKCCQICGYSESAGNFVLLSGDGRKVTAEGLTNGTVFESFVKPDTQVLFIDDLHHMPRVFIDKLLTMFRISALDIDIHVSGANVDFYGNSESKMGQLAMLGIHKQLFAICQIVGCNHVATRTQVLVDNKPLRRGAQFPDKYQLEARCTAHHYVPQ